MRLIDADTLKYFGNHIGDEYEDRFHDSQWVYRNDIDNALTIEIVRRKDCKYGHKVKPIDDGQDILCEWCDWEYFDNDFCSRGERKGGADDDCD